MTEQKTSQYSLDCASFNNKTLEHKVGRIKQAWAGCQFFPFKPGGVKTIFLTSPFIERAAKLIGRDLIFRIKNRRNCFKEKESNPVWLLKR